MISLQKADNGATLSTQETRAALTFVLMRLLWETGRLGDGAHHRYSSPSPLCPESASHTLSFTTKDFIKLFDFYSFSLDAVFLHSSTLRSDHILFLYYTTSIT